MKWKTLIAAGITMALWHAHALAEGSIEERIAAMERRIQDLENRVAAQDKTIVEKERQIAELQEDEGGWFDSTEVSGLIEIEAGRENPYEGDNASDVSVATVELGVAAQVHDWVGGEVVLLYEEGETDLEVDVATVTVGPPDGPWSFTAGQYYLPFGTFETTMISDPLTLEVGETRDTALQLGFSSGGLHGAVFGFNGDNTDNGKDRISGYGAAIGYSMENETSAFDLNLSYINDIGDSDSLQDLIRGNLGGSDEEDNEVDDHVAGWSAAARLRYGNISLMGEYLAAREDFESTEVEFDGDGAEPSSWMTEVAYDFSFAGREATFALGYQGTDEALALELPEERFLVGLSFELFEGTALAFEWAHDDDYDEKDGGSGEDANIITAQLATEF